MKSLFYLIICSLSFTICSGQWVAINSTQPVDAQVNLVSSNAGETVLSVNLAGYTLHAVTTPRGKAVKVSTPGSTFLLEAGAPEISKIATSLIIPDQSNMKVEVLSSAYTEFVNMEVAPSKGHLLRNTDPSTVPYTYGDVYSQDAFYPGTLAQLREPFILRDFRGQNIWIYPFQYNAVTKVLRVYSEITLRVSEDGQSGQNVFNRVTPLTSIDKEYAYIYNSLFKNGVSTTSYLPLDEDGSMLIISKTNYMAAMEPFITWKAKRGLTCEMISVDSIGNNSAAIKNFIINYYATHDLKFVLLVGDAQDIATPSMSGGASDPSYGFISGNDSYAEVIVGRFSAQSLGDVETQVQRSIEYEANPTPGGTWYQKGVGIASNQGPGDDGEMDFEHERNIRAGLLNYGFTQVDELYDGSQGIVDAFGNPNPVDLVNSINDGRSVINYTGHGSQNAVATTGFSTYDVPSLNNYGMLPFWWSVACVNGEFNNGTCLAESLLRIRSGNQPLGCIATFMSSINQYWNEPMEAQDEFDSLLTFSYTNNQKFTFGAISVNGCIKMNVSYGSSGADMTNTWHCFGDPSFVVRNSIPVSLAAAHDTIEPIGTSQLLVNCNIDDAVVTITKGSEIVGTGIVQNNICTLNFSAVMVVDTFDITATAFNCIPYFGKLYIVGTTGVEENSLVQTNMSISPNPVQTNATLNLEIPVASQVQITLLDEAGKMVQEISNSRMDAGQSKITFPTEFLSAGIYYVRVIAGNEERVLRLAK